MVGAGHERRLQLGELEELRLDAYEMQADYKERARLYHDRYILRREICEGDQVLLYSSRLRLMPGKLRSKWTGPYLVKRVFTHGAVELENPKDGSLFKVNGQRVKRYFGGVTEHVIEQEVVLDDEVVHSVCALSVVIYDSSSSDSEDVQIEDLEIEALPEEELEEDFDSDPEEDFFDDLEEDVEEDEPEEYDVHDPVTEPMVSDVVEEDVDADPIEVDGAPMDIVDLTGDEIDDQFDWGYRFPERSVDHGPFYLSLQIGYMTFDGCLLDSGSGINVIPEDIYQLMDVAPIRPFRGHLSLLDMSRVRPLGVVPNLVVMIGGVPVALDFLVVRVQIREPSRQYAIVLGRDFMYKTGARLDFGGRGTTLFFPQFVLTIDRSGLVISKERIPVLVSPPPPEPVAPASPGHDQNH